MWIIKVTLIFLLLKCILWDHDLEYLTFIPRLLYLLGPLAHFMRFGYAFLSCSLFLGVPTGLIFQFSGAPPTAQWIAFWVVSLPTSIWFYIGNLKRSEWKLQVTSILQELEFYWGEILYTNFLLSSLIASFIYPYWSDIARFLKLS